MKGDRPARWQHLDSQDERLLFSLAESGGDVGDIALDAMTHLPLRIESWVSIRSRLDHQLAQAETLERRRYLGRVLRWVPVFEPEDVVEDVFGLPNSNGLNRRVRNDADPMWMRAVAPGCVLLSDVELSLAAARPESRLRELRQLAEALKVQGWWFDAEEAPSIDELDSYTVTALFGLLSANETLFGNSLVAHIARNSQFRPELRGLFRVYWRTLAIYAKDTGRQLGSWSLDDRDDEFSLCWRAWQIAWTVSRGGIANVVAGLRSELSSSDLDECVVAIALIADAADYCVQSRAAIFGGGAAPERLAPHDPRLIFAESSTEDLGHLTESRTTTVVRIGSSAPRKVQQGAPFVARLVAYAPELQADADAILELDRPGGVAVRKEVRPSSWEIGANVVVALHGEGLEIRTAQQQAPWNGILLDFVFDATVDSATSMSSTVLGFEVHVAGVPVAHPRIEMKIGKTRSRPHRVRNTQRPTASAFCSYSHKDRKLALLAAAAYRTAGIDVFLDVLSLRAGDHWHDLITREITTRDRFILIWSHNARKSTWVNREVDIALGVKGDEAFILLPLEVDVPPHSKLPHLHSNDPAIIIASAQRAGSVD